MAKKSRINHPYLYTDGKSYFNKNLIPVIGLNSVALTRHHLYPKDRKDLIINKERYLLNIWGHKHFFGWNNLFQFSYFEGNSKIHTELTIDEIITLMIERHIFIVRKVGSKAWNTLFGSKTLDQALDLLLRMLSMKFNHRPMYVVHEKINFATSLEAA